MRAGPGHPGGGDWSQWIAAGPPKKKPGRMIPVENARPSSFVQIRGAPSPKRTDRLFAPRILIARDCLRKTRDAPSEQHDPLGFSHSHSPSYFAATLRLPPLALDFRQSELHRRTYPWLLPASPSGLFPWMRASISSVSHRTISGELPNCDLRNYGAWRGPKGPSLPLPRTEARLTRAENGRPDGCQKEIPGRRPPSLARSAQIGVSAERSGPMRQCQNAPMVAVYPRGCGGTGSSDVGPGCGEGLSPRVRGHLPFDAKRRAVRGSIPACAGASTIRRQKASRAWVYPRVCGEIGRASCRERVCLYV